MRIDFIGTAFVGDDIRMRLNIIEAACDLIEEIPFSKLTVGRICKEAHISRQTFYNYFKDKYDLIIWLESGIVNTHLLQIGCSKNWTEALEGILRDLPSNVGPLALSAANSEKSKFFRGSCARLISTQILSELEWNRDIVITDTLRFQIGAYPHTLVALVDAVYQDEYFLEKNEQVVETPMLHRVLSLEQRKRLAEQAEAFVPAELHRAMLTPRK